LTTTPAKEALRFGDHALTYPDLAAVAGTLARGLRGDRLAVWATPTLHTSVAVVAALLAGIPVVPINPKIGERELEHIIADSEPALVLAEPGVQLPVVSPACRARTSISSGSPATCRPRPVRKRLR
jgi:malonyl-CoA/methylmalonyl-CoA synthetase